MANRFPNLYVPGASKSGTSTLHELLNHHPEIKMSEIKEPHFWTHPDFNSFTKNEYNDYCALFESDKDILYRGESSTGYMVFTSFIKRIKSHYDNDPKFIFLLRNPIDRCYSHYWWLKGIGSEKHIFRDAILNDYRIEPTYEEHLPEGNFKNYFQFGLYGKWLSRFYSNFNPDSILIITFEELKESQLDTLNKCFLFLGIGKMEFLPKSHDNKTVLLKYPLLYKYSKQLAFKKYNLPSRLKQNLPNGLKKFFRKDLMELVLKHTKTNATYPKITEDDRSFLKIHYYDDVKKLKQITGLKFNEWTDFKNQL